LIALLQLSQLIFVAVKFNEDGPKAKRGKKGKDKAGKAIDITSMSKVG